MKFSAELALAGKTATGIEVPPEIVESLGRGKRVPVHVAIGPHTWRSTIAVYGGRYFLGVSAENRDAAGIKAGDVVEVDVSPDDEPRDVELPPDFAAALDENPEARDRFERLSYTHRKEHVRAILDAKAPETRQRRIEKAISMLEG
jgi:bifunctional DNA-binding transcriptional regulator/antitoxin component of YhaV-PrlF toxin-antitoxin module